MYLYALALIVISYVSFFFVSDQLNPFVITKAPLKRRHWRLGRAAAVSSLLSGMIALALLALNMLSERPALMLYLILVSVFILPGVVKYRKRSVWQ